MHFITKLSLLLVVTEIFLQGNDCSQSCKKIEVSCKGKKATISCESFPVTQVLQQSCKKIEVFCEGKQVTLCCDSVSNTQTLQQSCEKIEVSCEESGNSIMFSRYTVPCSDCFCDVLDCCLECSCATSTCETTTGNIVTSQADEKSDTTSTVSTSEDNIQNTNGTSSMTYYADITSEISTGTVARVDTTNTFHFNSTREPNSLDNISGSQKSDSVPLAIVIGVLVAIVAFAAVVVGVLCWYKRSRAFHKREGLEDTEHKPTLGINDDIPGSPINPYDVPDAKTMESNTKNEHVYCTLTDEKDNNTPVLDLVSPNGVYSLATNIPNSGVDRNLPNAPVPQVVYSLATNIPNSGADRNLPNAPVPEVVYSLATNIPNSGADRNLPNAPVQEQEYSLAKNVHTKEKCAAGSDTNSNEVNSQYFILESEHDRNDQYTSTEVPNNDQYFILEEQSETGGVLSEMKAIQPEVNIQETEYCALEPMDTSKHDADYTQLKQNSPKEEIIPDYFELEPDSSL